MLPPFPSDIRWPSFTGPADCLLISEVNAACLKRDTAESHFLQKKRWMFRFSDDFSQLDWRWQFWFRVAVSRISVHKWLSIFSFSQVFISIRRAAMNKNVYIFVAFLQRTAARKSNFTFNSNRCNRRQETSINVSFVLILLIACNLCLLLFFTDLLVQVFCFFAGSVEILGLAMDSGRNK